ncbi:MAG: hypothetical protein COA99_07645 [Moraxellaceae bacterium]|nr:MAG: hypothetical protein COA99_07645 [Moraxellaceae bacterium]
MARTIIYVHGTWADAASKCKMGLYPGTTAEGDALKAMVTAECGGSTSVNLLGFCWSGDANYAARKEAGDILAPHIEVHSGNELVFVTHSHGGNVLGHALEQLKTTQVQAVYLFACPIMTGQGKAWWTKGRKSVTHLHTFSTPNDSVQVTGAFSKNSTDSTASGQLNYSVGHEIDGVTDISLQSTSTFNAPHGWMHSEEAYKQAAKKLA